MRIFSKDAIRARSKFWYFMRTICPEKVKKASGEILACQIIMEKKPTKVKNFGIVVRYNFAGPNEVANMYKEYRALSRVAAVTKMCKYLFFSYLFFRVFLFLNFY
jgi:large subunit ribosomal protein L18Ae